MSKKTPYRDSLRRIGLIAAIWTAVALFFAAADLLRQLGRGEPIPWFDVFGLEFLYWLPWVFLTPLVLYMARRNRLEAGWWRRSVWAHLLAAFFVAFLQPAAAVGLQYFALATVAHAPRDTIDGFMQGMRAGASVLVVTAFWKYWIVLGVSYAFDYYRKYRDRELRASELEARLARAELQTLKMQLHPHFLFNALHSVSMLNLTDAEAGSRMLMRLSELLRITLDDDRGNHASLEDELDFIDRYLEIERIRFQDRLDVTYEIDEDVRDAQVPRLILQPLVENAIQHGVSRDSKAGDIRIRVAGEDGELLLEVADDGPGLPSGWDVRLDSGLGLGNTLARLEAMFGSNYKLEFVPSARGGLTVRMVIPLTDGAGIEKPAARSTSASAG